MAQRIRTFNSIEEVEKYINIIKKGGKRLIKIVIYEQEEECDPVFGRLKHQKARFMAQRAYLQVRRCNEFLYKRGEAQQWLVHLDEDVKQYVFNVFCNHENEAAKCMSSRGNTKFVCRIIGFIYSRDWYDVKSADPLADAIADMGRRDTLRRYIYEGFNESRRGLGFWD